MKAAAQAPEARGEDDKKDAPKDTKEPAAAPDDLVRASQGPAPQ